jgi:hypothetical protein
VDEIPNSLLAAVRTLVDGFEGAGIPYALGGAIAYSTWGEPRATRDVDLNVWLPTEELVRAFIVLEAAGIKLDRATALAQATERGLFVVYLGDYRVDVFVPSVPFYDVARERRVRVAIGGKPAWVLSAETLAVFKMLFFRPKDLVDIARMIEILGASFDAAFVRRALIDMLGEGDERIASWDRICNPN